MVSRVKDVATQLRDWQPANELLTAGAGLLKTALKDTVIASAASAVKVYLRKIKHQYERGG
jgi:hypothetical protein